MHVRWELQKILIRIALITTQVFMAEFLAAQLTDENKADLQRLVAKCIADSNELLGCVTPSSLEPLMRTVATPFGRAMEELKKMAVLVGEQEGSSVDEILRHSAELLSKAENMAAVRLQGETSS